MPIELVGELPHVRIEKGQGGEGGGPDPYIDETIRTRVRYTWVAPVRIAEVLLHLPPLLFNSALIRFLCLCRSALLLRRSNQRIIESHTKRRGNTTKMKKPHAIMISLDLQGHLNPFTSLAINLASKGFAVTFVHSEFGHHAISKSQLETTTKEDDLFLQARKCGLDIRYTTISDGFPLDFDRALNFVQFWDSLLQDFTVRADEFVGRIVGECDSSPFRPVLITDTFQPWTAEIAKKYDLVNVSFWTQSAMVFALNYHTDLLRENGHYPPKPKGHDSEESITYVPGVESIKTKDLMSFLQETDTTVVHRVVFTAFKEVKKADFILLNTVQELEPEAVQALNQIQPCYAIGPVNFSTQTKHFTSLLPETHCTQWLNSKPPRSVLYVSFGSLAQTSKTVMEEIAHGILLAGTNFIWVIREDIVGCNDSDILPVGLEEQLKEKGVIVKWCNQESVLSNPAVGGFLTHCGWNSVLESIWFGVPMICYPFLYDQLPNRKLVADDWRIGIDLCSSGAAITRHQVAEKIERLMMNEETRLAINQQIMKVRSTLHDALGDGGSSGRNLDRFVCDLTAKINARK